MQYLDEVDQQTCASNFHVQQVRVFSMANRFEKLFEQLPLPCQYHPASTNGKSVRQERSDFEADLAAFFYLANFFTGARIDHRESFAIHCFVPFIVDENLSAFDLYTWHLRYE